MPSIISLLNSGMGLCLDPMLFGQYNEGVWHGFDPVLVHYQDITRSWIRKARSTPDCIKPAHDMINMVGISNLNKGWFSASSGN